jgi:viroplasmin and RNaseH domain-containing protein
MKWYVVFRGRRPGVYNEWATCNAQVDGFKGASFRGCRTREEGEEALRDYFNNAEVVSMPQAPTCLSCRMKNYILGLQIVIIAVMVFYIFRSK